MGVVITLSGDGICRVDRDSTLIRRRHSLSCIHNYRQNKRIFRPRTKAKIAKDCTCPIQAEGVLKIEGRITNRSTHCYAWDEAEATTRQWETWGQTESPVVDAKTIDVTVESMLPIR